METGSHWLFSAIGLSKIAQDFLQTDIQSLFQWVTEKRFSQLRRRLLLRTHAAQQCQSQAAGQKLPGKHAEHVAWFEWADRLWKVQWNPSPFIQYSFTVQSRDMGYSCKKQGLFEAAKFKYSRWNRIEISCQDRSRKPEHYEHLSLQGNKILKLHKNRIRVLNPNVFVILKYNSLQVFMAVAERMGISFSRQAPLFQHSCYQAVDLWRKAEFHLVEIKTFDWKLDVEMATWYESSSVNSVVP